MRRAVIVGLIAAVLVGGYALVAQAPPQWSVLVLIAEPPGGAWLPAPGRAAQTPRLRKLAGAGVRLPLAPPEVGVPEYLSALLGAGGPAAGVLGAWEQRGWERVVASSVPLPETVASRFSHSSNRSGGAVVDSLLDGLEEAGVRPGEPALAVLIAQPRDAAAWDTVVSRAVDGAASRLTLARTLVVVIDRGERAALLIAPQRPAELLVPGAFGAQELGAELNRWLRL